MKNLSKVKLAVTSISFAVGLIALSVGSSFATGTAPVAFQDGALFRNKLLYLLFIASCEIKANFQQAIDIYTVIN